MTDKLIITKDGIIEENFTPEEIEQRELDIINSLPTLLEIQQQKIIELNTACNQDILNGFSSFCTGVEHQYNFDLEYQANMNQRATMFLLKPTMVETWWPTKDKGVITHTREQFVQLCEDAERTKDEKIFRYFGMKAQILAPTITTAEQVEAFVW